MITPSVFPAEGTRFGLVDDELELGRELGGGTQGRVYVCTRLRTGNQYAVKVVNTNALDLREHTLANLRREISVMRELHHPRIVNLREAFWEGSLCCIVMDLARGGDLHRKLERGKGLGSEIAVRHVAHQLLEGIGYMHSHNVIHRDLKPENVLIVRSRPAAADPTVELHDVKIADFGLSKALKRLGEDYPGMTACGTLDYLAPEVLTGHYDEAIDFWSFGVLLYMMLCGAFPFTIEGVSDINSLSAKKISCTKAWQEVSEEARDIVRSLLTVDRTKRLGLDGCFRHHWLAEEVANATPASADFSHAGTPRHAGSPNNRETDTVSLFVGLLSPVKKGFPDFPERPIRSVGPTQMNLVLQPPYQGVIKQISGKVGAAVDSVELQFRDGPSQFHGGRGGKEQHTWYLRQDELILAVAQETRNAYLGDALVFYTSECQIISVQGADARRRNRLVAPLGSQIVGLQFENSHLTGIHLEKASLNGCTPHGAIQSISGRVGSAVDKIVLQLRDGAVRRYGTEGGSLQGPRLLEPDELIIIVEQGRKDAFLGNSIAFYTSAGNVVEFRGMEAAHSRRFVAPEGFQICGLSFEGDSLVGVTICPWSGDMSCSRAHARVQE